jgi:hypothetical protein
VKITASDAAMGMVPGVENEKVRFYKFHVWAKGLSTKEEFDKLNGEGRVVEEEICYENEKQVVTVTAVSGYHAKISAKKPNSGLGIRDINPVFMEYWFLDQRADIVGVPSFSPRMIETSAALQDILSKAKVIKGADNGVELDKNGRRFSVTFGGENKERGYYPHKIEFSDPIRNTLSTIEVVSKTTFPVIGESAKEIRMTTSLQAPDQSPLVLATWEFVITKLLINPEINDEQVEFDPASVNSIWDNDHKIWIEVPD